MFNCIINTGKIITIFLGEMLPAGTSQLTGFAVVLSGAAATKIK